MEKRDNLVVGILQETKEQERRAPLVPSDVEWLVDRGIAVEVEHSRNRIFSDKEYNKNGSRGITVFAVDNLPAEMPGDASDDFSGLIRDYIYQIAVHGVKDITNHMAIPAEIRNAVITQDGRLTEKSAYLRKYIS